MEKLYIISYTEVKLKHSYCYMSMQNRVYSIVSELLKPNGIINIIDWFECKAIQEVENNTIEE